MIKVIPLVLSLLLAGAGGAAITAPGNLNILTILNGENETHIKSSTRESNIIEEDSELFLNSQSGFDYQTSLIPIKIP